MLDPEVVAAYDIVADRYDEFYASKPVFAAENLAIKHLLERGGYLEGPLLELGCRTGQLLDLVPEAIADDDYLGVDTSTKMVWVARRKHRKYHFSVGTVRRAPPEFFASIVSLYGLSYAPQLVNGARGIWRALRGDGRFCILHYARGRRLRGDYLLSTAGLRAPPEGTSAAELTEAFDVAGLDVTVRGFGYPDTLARLERERDIEGAAAILLHEMLAEGRPPDQACYLLAVGTRRQGGRNGS
jgi:SAM-dependent methyltransferase